MKSFWIGHLDYDVFCEANIASKTQAKYEKEQLCWLPMSMKNLRKIEGNGVVERFRCRSSCDVFYEIGSSAQLGMIWRSVDDVTAFYVIVEMIMTLLLFQAIVVLQI